MPYPPHRQCGLKLCSIRSGEWLCGMRRAGLLDRVTALGKSEFVPAHGGAYEPMNFTELLPLPAGLVAVTGEEGAGKTRLLRRIGERPGSIWLDLSLPGRDDEFPKQVWDQARKDWSSWDEQLQLDLADALGLAPHLGKKLSMLSTGTRRKVALVVLLASGATVTCLDQPFAALDAASKRMVHEFLADVADHQTRTWIVADYEVDMRLPWRRHIVLP